MERPTASRHNVLDCNAEVCSTVVRTSTEYDRIHFDEYPGSAEPSFIVYCASVSIIYLVSQLAGIGEILAPLLFYDYNVC